MHYYSRADSPVRVEAVPEAGGWSVLIPGLPLATDGSTLHEAVTEMIDALREYAADWQDHLLDAPNHREHWDLVQLIRLSDDVQLRNWLVASTRRSGKAPQHTSGASCRTVPGPGAAPTGHKGPS